MPYLSIRGVDHYYEWITNPDDAADLEASSRPTLVFLHGWAGSARYWESTARSLAGQFNCLLYDLRGFGRSALPRPVPAAVEALGYELESYADDLAALLDALALPQVILNAHSTGASIAVQFLNRYADRVSQAVLTCNGIFEYDARSFQAFHQFGGYVVKFRPKWLTQVPGLDRLFMQRFVRRSLPAAERRAFLEDFVMADYEAALGTIFTAVSEKAAIEMPIEFAKLTLPTLLVSGEFDQIIPASMGQRAAALNPQIKYVMIPETAHFPMLEDPNEYLRQVRSFLRVPHPVA